MGRSVFGLMFVKLEFSVKLTFSITFSAMMIRLHIQKAERIHSAFAPPLKVSQLAFIQAFRQAFMFFLKAFTLNFLKFALAFEHLMVSIEQKCLFRSLYHFEDDPFWRILSFKVLFFVLLSVFFFTFISPSFTSSPFLFNLFSSSFSAKRLLLKNHHKSIYVVQLSE